MISPSKRADKTMRIDIDPAATSLMPPAEPSETLSGVKKPTQPWRKHYSERSTPFYRMLEAIYDAVLVTSLDGKILEANERATDFFLIPQQKLWGRNIIHLISGATEALIATVHQNLTDKKYTLVEARCKRADGTSFAAEIAVNKVELDTDGQLCFLVRDITLRQQSQRDLEDALERLQAHDRARMEFVSNVSHELRTPLTSMIYAINNMLRGVVGPMPDKAIAYLERLQTDTRRLLATVNDILDLRQIENKTLILSKSVVPLGAVLQEGAETLQIQAETKQIKINFDANKRELFSCCDLQKIERVILNILGNAVKFTGEGGEITLLLEQNPENLQHALITVKDTGMGVPPEMLSRLSQRYFRVGDHVAGSGLGLAISREIIELHEGTLNFASPVPGSDCGTAVYVTLPLAPKPLVIMMTPDPAVGELVKQEITASGYGFARAYSSQEALDLCFTRQPVVFLLDRNITDMDVRDVVLRLRENNSTKRLPVILFGVQSLQRNELETYRRFGIYFISLPWQDAELRTALAMAVLGKLR